MRRRCWLLAATLVAGPAIAQEPPPSDFTRIRLAPGPVEGEGEGEGPPAPRRVRIAPTEIRGTVEEAPAEGAPADAVRVKPTPAARPARKKRRGPRVQLRGTGAEEGRRTRWGVVETLTPLEAAQRRAEAGGDEVALQRQVRFHHDSVRFQKGSEAALREMADRLQSAPEIRLVLIEGHTDQSGSQRYNQKLSEARASAVREALVRLGVAPERLVAYGRGETQPASRQPAVNRRVVLRVVEGDRPALQSRAATEWGQAAVVGVWGDVRWAQSPEIDDADDDGAPLPDDLDWQALPLKTQIAEGVDLETGPEGRLLLRLPDLTRILLEPETRVRIAKLFYDNAAGKAYTAVKVRRGAVQVVANPLERGISRSLFAFPGGAAEAVHADFTLAVDPDGSGHLSVARGRVELANGRPESFGVAAGQRLALGVADGTPQPQLAAPRIGGPVQGDFAEPPPLEWVAVADADGYLVEIARDVEFLQPVLRHRVGTTRYVATDLPPEQMYYWRVRAVDAAGSVGVASRIHAFRVTQPRSPEKKARRDEDAAALNR